VKWFDKYLQKVRLKKAGKFLKEGSVVLDIGSDDGILFKTNPHIKFGIGIDPNIREDYFTEKYKLIKGCFPQSCPAGLSFDVIAMLAVLEHIPKNEQYAFAGECFNALKKDGIIIITVPSPRVDNILAVLKKLKIIDGMSLEEHFGFKPGDVKFIFDTQHFSLLHHKKFQFGLNNIFVFQKIL